MDTVGGGLFGVIILPVAITVVMLVLRRTWAAIYFAAASVVSAGLVQLLKNLFDRPRPEDMLVVADIGSFPSGHVANAATMAVVLGFILQRTWVWVAGIAYAILMMLSRTYLGAHWVSDTIGGLVLGAGVAVVLWAPFAHRLHLERRKPILARP
jgi:undecaprenyl-diphosphatase